MTVMTQSNAGDYECCVDRQQKCAGPSCAGWRWSKWKAGMAAPDNATVSGPTQRLMIAGEEVGYCGRAGPSEYS